MKIITRIQGGLGNQLFSYAAARRLALANNAELVIDDVTGFLRDHIYNRRYMLDVFSIPCRKATPAERLEPFERYRRACAKYISRFLSFERRRYIARESIDFDPRLLTLKVQKTLYLDGVWLSEKYFKDFEQVIRQDLVFNDAADIENSHIAKLIKAGNSVAIHFRWFDLPRTDSNNYNMTLSYYQTAIKKIQENISKPQYFIFSDYVNEVKPFFKRLKIDPIFVTGNQSEQRAYIDLCLMSQCQHFIIANSTFSWWGAWLSTNIAKTVIAPGHVISGMTSWGFSGLIPDNWIRVVLP
jgi:hypothetical protein